VYTFLGNEGLNIWLL